MRSSSSTCVGPPGARAMHCAIGGSSAGTTFGPPEPTTSEVEERLDEKRQPVAIDARVGVGVGDDLAGRFGQADVARGAQAAVRRVDRRGRADALRPISLGAILRAVVDEDDLVVRIRQLLERARGCPRACRRRCRRRRRPRRAARSRCRSRENGASANAAGDRARRRLRPALGDRRGRTSSPRPDGRRATTRRSRRTRPRRTRLLRTRRGCASP